MNISRSNFQMQVSTLTVPVAAPTITLATAKRIADAYLVEKLDPTYEAVSGTLCKDQATADTIWQFVIRSPDAPLDTIQVDAETSTVIPLADQRLRMIQERAYIAAAKQRNELPTNQQGFVLAEYARRKANGYLVQSVNMYLGAEEPIFLPLARPVWQVEVYFKMDDLGPFAVEFLDVDARTGEVIPYTEQQIQQIYERTDAFVKSSSLPPTRTV
jgi:hypothetical protein